MHCFPVVQSPTNIHNHCLIHYFLQLLPRVESTTCFMSFNLHCWSVSWSNDYHVTDHFMHFKPPPSIYLAWSNGYHVSQSLTWPISTVDQPHLIQWLLHNLAWILARPLSARVRTRKVVFLCYVLLRLITWNSEIQLTTLRARKKLLTTFEARSIISARFLPAIRSPSSIL